VDTLVLFYDLAENQGSTGILITRIDEDADGNGSPDDIEQHPSNPLNQKKSGGGALSLTKDTCPAGDFSPSYYDGRCGNHQHDAADDQQEA
jgi:hypothetical protein